MNANEGSKNCLNQAKPQDAPVAKRRSKTLILFVLTGLVIIAFFVLPRGGFWGQEVSGDGTRSIQSTPETKDNQARLGAGDKSMAEAVQQLKNQAPQEALASLTFAKQQYGSITVGDVQTRDILAQREARFMALMAYTSAALGDSRAGNYASEALSRGNKIGDQQSVALANEVITFLGGSQNQPTSHAQHNKDDTEAFCRHQAQEAMAFGSEEADRTYNQCILSVIQQQTIQMEAENCVQLGIGCSKDRESKESGSRSSSCYDNCAERERGCDKVARLFSTPGGYEQCQVERHDCNISCQ
jgi:hypothetical protein